MPHGELDATASAKPGDPCRICGGPIGPYPHHVHARRHVCSKHCHETLTSLAAAGVPFPPAIVDDKPTALSEPVTSWVALDFETANSSRASVCQVGAAAVTDNKVTDVFGSLVRPMDGFGDFYGINTHTHGLTAHDVARSPQWPDVWGQLTKFIAERPIVAHNAASVEVSMIRQSCELWGLPNVRLGYACSQQIGKKVWNVGALKKCAAAAGVALTNHHDALADAVACAEVTVAAMRETGIGEINGLLRGLGLDWGVVLPYDQQVSLPTPEATFSLRYRR